MGAAMIESLHRSACALARISRGVGLLALVGAVHAPSSLAFSTDLPLSGRMVGAPALVRTNSPTAPTLVAFVTDDSRFTVMDVVHGIVHSRAELPARPVTGLASGVLLSPLGLGFFLGLEDGEVRGLDQQGNALSSWPSVHPAGPVSGGPIVGNLVQSILDRYDLASVVAGTTDGSQWTWNQAWVTGSQPRRPGVALLTPAMDDFEAPVPGHHFTRGLAMTSADGWLLIDRALAPLVTMDLGSPPTAPVVATLQGRQAAIVAAGNLLHAVTIDGAELPGFPVALPGAVAPGERLALADLDRDGVRDIVIPIASPPSIDVRDASGASLSSLGWPRPLAEAALGAPIVGPVSGRDRPDLVVATPSGLLVLTSSADSVGFFALPAPDPSSVLVWDLDGDGGSEVLAASTTEASLHVFDAGPATWTPSLADWPALRGNMGRTGSASDPPPTFVLDVVAPGAVRDLEMSPMTGSTALLQWTAPSGGGAGDSGPVTADVRRSTSTIDESTFDQATQAGTFVTSAGAINVVLGGLQEGERYNIALRSVDVQGNRSRISNVVSFLAADAAPPASIQDLTAFVRDSGVVMLRWTAPGDDGTVGRAGAYDLRGSPSLITAENFEGAPRFATGPPGPSGTRDSVVISEIAPGLTYHFALRAADDRGNMGGVSNLISVFLEERVAPGKIQDLSARRSGYRSYTLTWTAPGDDGMVGRATRYLIQRMTDGGSSRIVNGPVPGAAGTMDSLSFDVHEGVGESFLIRAIDEAGNSNLGSTIFVRLDPVPPARVVDLRVLAATDSSVSLAWTAVGDDSLAGRASFYDVRAADHSFTPAEFESAPILRRVGARFESGDVERTTVRLPSAGTTYWFAIRAYDPDQRPSAVSSVITAATTTEPRSDRIALRPLGNPSRLPAVIRWQSAPGFSDAPQRLRIFDPSGRVVRTIALGRGIRGSASWDGKDTKGHRVQSGLYILRLESGPRHTQARLVLLP
jgi:hypothetical protein